MEWLIILGITIGVILLLVLLISFYVYLRIFYNNIKGSPGCLEPLKGELYKVFEDKSRELIKKALSIPYEQVSIKVDRRTLSARYYAINESGPTSILVHGYKGNGIRDFSGGVQELIKRKSNVLVIDHHGHNLSSGRTITFGVKEKYDVLRWIDYVNKRNNNPTIYLYGISMGASTVLMDGGLSLPSNVKAIIADCPYRSAKEEIKFTVNKMGLKYGLIAPFIHLAAFIFAGFKIKDGEVSKFLKKCKLPILLIHGTTDDIVPVENSRMLSKEFPGLIKYVEIEGAPHGMSYFVDYEKYSIELDNFLNNLENKK